LLKKLLFFKFHYSLKYRGFVDDNLIYCNIKKKRGKSM